MGGSAHQRERQCGVPRDERGVAGEKLVENHNRCDMAGRWGTGDVGMDARIDIAE